MHDPAPAPPTTASPAAPIAFGIHLKAILDAQNLTQQVLADRSGLSAGAISRIINGGRQPNLDTLEEIAEVLGTDVPRLVIGTDAETRIIEARTLVRRADLEAATKQIVDLEHKGSDLAARLRERDELLAQETERRKQAENQRDALASQLRDLHWQRERQTADLEEARRRGRDLEGTVRRYRAGLSRAVAEVSALKQKLAEVAEEVTKNGVTTTITAILAGVAATTGVVTVASFIRDAVGGNDDEDADDDSDADDLDDAAN